MTNGESTMTNSKENNHIDPKHYKSHPSGIECIEITRHFCFNLGNVFKYLWRFDKKGAPVEDLKKASWYLFDELLLQSGKEESKDLKEKFSKLLDEI
jgi:hypothetical protein